MADIRDIRWRTRRGMKELDLFLIPFFEDTYKSMDISAKEVFIELLDESDPSLFSCLMGHGTLEDKKLQAMIDLIRKYKLKDNLEKIQELEST